MSRKTKIEELDFTKDEIRRLHNINLWNIWDLLDKCETVESLEATKASIIKRWWIIKNMNKNRKCASSPNLDCICWTSWVCKQYKKEICDFCRETKTLAPQSDYCVECLNDLQNL